MPGGNNGGFLGGVPRRIGNEIRDSAMQTGRGIRRAVPGTRDFNWRQAVDFFTEPLMPGNFYNSETGRLQMPGAGVVRGIGNIFRRDGDPGEGNDALRQPGQQPDNGPGFLDRLFPGRQPSNPPGMPLQPGMPPLANVPAAQLPPTWTPSQIPQYGYHDPNGVGPPAYLAGTTPMPRPTATPTAGRQGRAGRFGDTVLTGQAAQDFARGLGQGARSYGWHFLMGQNREN